MRAFEKGADTAFNLQLLLLTSSGVPSWLAPEVRLPLTTLLQGPRCPCTNSAPCPAARAAHALGGQESGRRRCGTALLEHGSEGPWGWHGGKTLWPGQLAKSQAGHQSPRPPNTGHPELQMSAGLVWEGRLGAFLLVAGSVLCCVGMLVLLPNLGSSWSYKLHSSLHSVAGLPCPRVIRDHPDGASVAAHN